MKRKPRTGGLNFWPGYVDAMTNVVLNLLFMVAMFGVTLSISNSVSGPQGNGKQRSEEVRGYEATELTDAASRLPDVGITAAPPVDVPDQGKSELTVKAAIPAADTSTTRSDKTRAITVVDAFQRSGGPRAALKISRRSVGQVLIQMQMPDGSDPLSALKRSNVAATLKIVVVPGVSTLRIWGTATSDPQNRRNAFLALAALRNQAVGLGVSRTSIETRIYPEGPTTHNGTRFYVLVDGARAEPVETDNGFDNSKRTS